MRNIHEHVARLHTHLEDTRGEMRHLLHENLRKQDALQEQLRHLTHELSQEREATAQARAAARDAQERLLAWTAQMEQATHQAQQERAELLSFIRPPPLSQRDKHCSRSERGAVLLIVNTP